jgi:fructoselysine-6-P-deglycase FrlB-like protein
LADHISAEIRSQPPAWRRASRLREGLGSLLPAPSARLAVAGCGTSYYVAKAFAAAREAAGAGETDAFPASEMPLGRDYDCLLAISRSGTTTEVVRLLEALDGRGETIAVSAVPRSPVVEAASRAIVLDFADERSLVQTRFATTTLALLRVHLGVDIEAAARDAERALADPLPCDPEHTRHFVFLGRGWTVGLADEAALKMRETSGTWAESYPAMEYRHGPISVAGRDSVVWALGDVPGDLLQEVEATGACVVREGRDPMAELVMIQRVAVARALALGRDPDHPARLARSVVLD